MEKIRHAIVNPTFLLALFISLVGLAQYVFSLEGEVKSTNETVKVHIAASAVDQERYIQTQKQLTELKTQMDILLPEMQRLNRRLDETKGKYR